MWRCIKALVLRAWRQTGDIAVIGSLKLAISRKAVCRPWTGSASLLTGWAAKYLDPDGCRTFSKEKTTELALGRFPLLSRPIARFRLAKSVGCDHVTQRFF
jgi:hypothetical protein